MDLKALRNEALEATSRFFLERGDILPDEDSDEWEAEYHRQFELAKRRAAARRAAAPGGPAADAHPEWPELTGAPAEKRWGAELGSSLFGGLRSSAFRLSASPTFEVTRGSSLLFGISSSALPSWDQENETAQSDARPDRAWRDRYKSHSELAPSIVPRGTSIRRRRNSRVSGRSAGTVRRRQARPLSSNGIPCHRSTCDA
jgi:hypothetical protein